MFVKKLQQFCLHACNICTVFILFVEDERTLLIIMITHDYLPQSKIFAQLSKYEGLDKKTVNKTFVYWNMLFYITLFYIKC